MNENDDTSVSLICKDPAAFEKDKDSHYFQFYYLKAKKEEKKTARQVLEARKKGPQCVATHDGKTKICVDYDEKKWSRPIHPSLTLAVMIWWSNHIKT